MAMKILYVVLFIAAIAANIPHANAGTNKITNVIFERGLKLNKNVIVDSHCKPKDN